MGLLVFLLVAVGQAEVDPARRAMKLYGVHRYEDAAKMLRESLASIAPERQPSAHLALGMAYLKSGELHLELYLTSLSVHLDYLNKISTLRGETNSTLKDLYLGEVLLEVGESRKATRYFEKCIANKRLEQKYREIARVKLGLCYHLQGKKLKARNVWRKIKGTDPEVLSELSATYCMVDMAREKAGPLSDKAIALIKANGEGIPIRVAKNLIGIYAENNQIEKGLDLLERSDLKAFSAEELLGTHKVLRFYNPALLNNIAKLYGKASIQYLTRVTAGDRAQKAASYYLGEAYAMLDSFEESAAVTASFLSSTSPPEQFKRKAKARQAALLHLKGQGSEATGRWETLLLQQPNSPTVFADILNVCVGFGLECDEIAAEGAVLAQAVEGKRGASLNSALGRYYLTKKDYGKTIQYLELGRDKGNKNKIEHNDPLMLIHLAHAYYQTMQFSEALEIYFNLDNQFPAVRQIQVAMQGVYAMKQKSAGDVRLF